VDQLQCLNAQLGNPPHYPPQGVFTIKGESVRTIRLRLPPTLKREEILGELGDYRTKLWKQLSYKRRKPSTDKRLTRET